MARSGLDPSSPLPNSSGGSFSRPGGQHPFAHKAPANNAAGSGAGDKTMLLATKCLDEDEFIRRFHPFAGSEALAIPGSVPGEPGTEGRFVIALKDQRPVMQGRCRIEAVKTAADGTRTSVVLTLLDLEPRSRRVHERLLSRRKVMGMDVTPVPATVAPKSTTLKLGGAVAARRGEPLPETRTPGSSFQLPANPLSHLDNADLASFVECTLFEELDAAPVADRLQQPDADDGEAHLPVSAALSRGDARRVRTKLFFTSEAAASSSAEQHAAGNEIEPFDQVPTQPQQPSPWLQAQARADTQDRTTGSKTSLDAGANTVFQTGSKTASPDELTTPGFDNPPSAVRHLLQAAEPGKPRPSHVRAGEVASALPSALPSGVSAGAPARTGNAGPLATPASVRTPKIVSTAFATVPASLQPHMRKWAPIVTVASAAFALGFWVRGPSVPAAAPAHQNTATGAESLQRRAVVTPLVTQIPRPVPPAEARVPTPPPAPKCFASIRSAPNGARVSWGTMMLGRTPLAGVEVPCGAAEVTVTRALFEPHQHNAIATAESPVQVDVNLKRQRSVVVITSEPAGAAVMVNNKSVGVTPHQLNVARGQRVALRVGRVGFRTWINTIGATAPSLPVHVQLTPLAAAAKPQAGKLEAKVLAKTTTAKSPRAAAVKPRR